jgi:methylated-DNA-[protein]-cysteine S-methyltransferase
MRAIVESKAVRAERRSYTVPGWGEGELWIGAGLVLANDFQFSDLADSSSRVGAGRPQRATTPSTLSTQSRPPTPPKGATKPPSNTVAGTSERLGNRSVTKANKRVDPDDVVARVCAFLDGAAVELSDVPLDLESLSHFQRAVTTALREVPRGEVVTYSELALLAGRPRAQRAAGSVCARNPFMFLVPCHRVIAADGIGGYGSAGRGIKRRLLALEGVQL